MYSVHNSTSEDLSTSEEARRKVTTWLDDIAMNHSQQDYLSKMSKEVDHKKSLQSESEDQQNNWQNVVSILQRSAGLSEAPGNGLSSTMHNGCNPHLD